MTQGDTYAKRGSEAKLERTMAWSGKAKLPALMAAALLLSACGSRDREPSLLNIRSQQQTPDEFAILPTGPLQEPPDYAALPPPTPGGRNLVDPDPEGAAVAALGGDPGALRTRGTIPGADSALFAHATRYGVTPTIRSDLAAADLEFRRQNDGRLLERLFNVNVYFRAYESMSLDQYAELERWRALGVIRTPSAPPDPEAEE